MTQQMAIPFAIGPDGSVATVSNPVRALSARVRALTATLPTQRVMRSTFGVPTVDVMFAWDPSIGQMQLERMVTEAVNLWEPAARVISVRPVMTPDGADVVGVDVDISAGDSLAAGPSPQYSIRISANGDVERS